MKHTRRLTVLVLVLALVVPAAGIARADILAKKDAEDAFNDLQNSVKDEGGPPLKRKEVEDAKANLGQISDEVAPLVDASSDLKEIKRIVRTVIILLEILKPVPYVGPVARGLYPVTKDAYRLDVKLQSYLNMIVKPAKYLDKTASLGKKAMNSTLDQYFIYNERDKVEKWEFPGEYGIGGGMNYSCFKTEIGDYKAHMIGDEDMTGDLENVNHYLREIHDPVTGFNTVYDKASKDLGKFEELFKPFGDLSDDLSEIKHISKQINAVLKKEIGFTIDPKDFLDYKVSTTIDFVPEEIYDKTVSYTYDYHFTWKVTVAGQTVYSHTFTGSVGVDFSVKDALHSSVDAIIDDVVDKVFDDIKGPIPDKYKDKIKGDLEDLLSGLDDAAQDLKDMADKMVDNAEKHWDVEVSVATVLDGEEAIEDKILTFIPEKYRKEVKRLVDLDKYIQEIRDQVGTIDIEFSVEKALKGIDTLEDLIMKGVADELAWLMKAYGLEDAAQKIENLAKGEVDPLLDQFPSKDIIPGYKEVKDILVSLQAPIRALKHDLNQIIGEDIPTVNRKYYEGNDLESLSKGEYKGKCHKDFWD